MGIGKRDTESLDRSVVVFTMLNCKLFPDNLIIEKYKETKLRIFSLGKSYKFSGCYSIITSRNAKDVKNL